MGSTAREPGGSTFHGSVDGTAHAHWDGTRGTLPGSQARHFGEAKRDEHTMG